MRQESMGSQNYLISKHSEGLWQNFDYKENATNVLERGIYVTASNLVLCFDPPSHVKSFIQRRGRALQETSQYVIMFPAGEGNSRLEKWQSIEVALIKEYQTGQKILKDLR
jgi:ERCC4-related helicase